MRYRNAADILPGDLLNRVRKFHIGLLWIPKTGRISTRQHRNKKIFQLRRSGMPIAGIACKMELSARQVRRILSHIHK